MAVDHSHLKIAVAAMLDALASALEIMSSLGKADLTCLQPETHAEAGAILDHLLGV